MSQFLYLSFFLKKVLCFTPNKHVIFLFETLVICWFPLLFSPLFYNAFPISFNRKAAHLDGPTSCFIPLGVNELLVQCLVMVTGFIIFLGLNYSTLGIGKKI